MKLPKELILRISAFGLLGLIGLSSELALAQYRRPSRTYCEQFARDYARRNSQGRALGEAATGAIGGAIIGGILGDAGTGAGIGALVGGIGGSSRESRDYNYLFNIAYDDCMRGRTGGYY